MWASVCSIAQERSDLVKADKYFDLCDFDRAKEIYEDVLKKDPENVHALWMLGDIFWLNFDYESAYTYYGIASGMDWKSDEHVRRYVEVLMINGDYSNALKWATNLKVRNPEMGDYLMRRVSFSEKHFDDPASYTVEYHDMNSGSSDFGATFIAQDYMVYASARSDMKRVFQNKGAEDWAGRSLNQLFVAPSMSSGDLDQPLFYRSDIENNYNEGPIGVSGNGKWVAVTKNNFLDGINQVYMPGMEMSLYLGILDDQGNWKDLKPFEHNIQGYSTGMATLSKDGNTICFASNRPDGFGGFDLYISEKIDGEWSFPRNLGPTINTVGNEITPHIDGADLYFSSDLQPGYGGFDIYRCELNGQFQTNKVYHLGNAVNSKFDDNYFTFSNDEQSGFLTSTRRLDGNEDIYTVVGLGKRIVIKVVDSRSGTGISNAKIDFGTCSLNDLTTDEEGETSLRTINDVNCTLKIGKRGYGLVEIPFDTRSRSYFEIALYPKEEKSIATGITKDQEGKALGKVYIRAIRQVSGQFEEYFSDDNGNFELELRPYHSYTLEFAKSGYLSQKIKITTDDRLTSDLPPISLNKQVDQVESIEKNENVILGSASSMVISKGFSIQLGAYSDLESLDYDQYGDLSDLGMLYTKFEGDVHKLRLGVYDSEETARNIRKMLELRGFSKVFLVKETGDQKTKSIKKEVKTTSSSAPFELPYGVRLGAFSKPELFGKDQAAELGEVHSFIKDDLTIFQIVNILDLDAAKKVVKKAGQLGFKDAYIMVIGTDNQYVKLK